MKQFRKYRWWFLFFLIILLYIVKSRTNFFEEPSRDQKKPLNAAISN
ncbi:MAG TPA: hypothetical protein VNR87_02640 [Flavisolibacter sp.]|nr:hypothetical protein [Flavisolibacter sp.]